MKSKGRTLDRQLLFEARRLMSGANVHRMKELIFAYEQAIDLHNRSWATHQIYQPEPEARLRSYVFELRMETESKSFPRCVREA